MSFSVDTTEFKFGKIREKRNISFRSISLNSDIFPGPAIKIERAKQHLIEFEKELPDFIDKIKNNIKYYYEEKSDEIVVYVYNDIPIPKNLNVIIGDIVHNLRSSLDQVIACILRKNNIDIKWDHGFPIVDSKEMLDKIINRKLRGAPDCVKEFVLRLKPYKAGGCEALWLLSKLNNTDKHSDIVPIAVATPEVRARIGVPMAFFTQEGRFGIGACPPGGALLGHQWGLLMPEGARVVKLNAGRCEVFRINSKISMFEHHIFINFDLRFGGVGMLKYGNIADIIKVIISVTERVVRSAERFIDGGR